MKHITYLISYMFLIALWTRSCGFKPDKGHWWC